MADFNWGLFAAWLHMPVVVAAVVLLAVPRWRRWLLSQLWSPVLFIVAAYGAFYIAMLWPDALGGWSVGLPLLLTLFGGLLIWVVFSFVSDWRNDRSSAIELLALMVIFGGSTYAAEQFVGKDYWWLAFGPMLAWIGVRWLMIRTRTRPGRSPSSSSRTVTNQIEE